MKKYVISAVILLILWAGVWASLVNYEKSFPNGSIIEFSKMVFNDLGNIKIVKKVEENNLFDIYKNDSKLIQVLALKEDDEWKVSLEERYVKPIDIYVPQGAEVYIDSKILDKKNIVDYERTDRFTLLNNEELLPKIECYRINNYIDIPSVEVIFEDRACITEVENRNVNAYLVPEDNENLDNILLDTSKFYARYVTNDAEFSELSPYLYKNTDFYKGIKGFYNDWYAHTGYEFRNVNIESLQKISNNAFKGRVSFEYILKKGAKEFSYPSKYEIYFVNVDNAWKAICIDTL